MPDARSSSRTAASLVALSSSCSVRACDLAVVDAPARAGSAPRPSDRAARRGRWRAPRPGRPRCGAARAAPRSPGARGAAAPWPASSASLRSASASRRASSSSDSAFRVSASARTPVNFFCRRNPTDPPTSSAATTATATTRTSTKPPLSPAPRRGMSDPARTVSRAPVGNHTDERHCKSEQRTVKNRCRVARPRKCGNRHEPVTGSRPEAARRRPRRTRAPQARAAAAPVRSADARAAPPRARRRGRARRRRR